MAIRSTQAMPDAEALFAIITIVKDDPEGLRRTLESLAAQTIRNYSLCIIDGASAAPTRAVIDAFAHLATTIISERDRGIFDAMNKGLHHCQGRYVLYLNAGDILSSPDALAVMTRHLGALDYPDMMYFDAVDERGVVINPIRRIEALYSDSIGCHQATLIDRQWHLRFPFDLGYPVSAERDVQVRVLRAGARAANIAETVVIYDTTGNSARRIYRKSVENILINWRNRVGLVPMLRTVPKEVARTTAFFIARRLGIDWGEFKAFFRRIGVLS